MNSTVTSSFKLFLGGLKSRDNVPRLLGPASAGRLLPGGPSRLTVARKAKNRVIKSARSTDIKIKGVKFFNFAERAPIFTIEVSYEIPEKNKQDGTKFISVLLRFHGEK